MNRSFPARISASTPAWAEFSLTCIGIGRNVGQEPATGKEPGKAALWTAGFVGPQPAVSIGPGAIWGRVYDAVTVQGGRYVQGGGCLTVGVAGLIQGGGFGSFSKAFGMAGASLIEAEVVIADGAVKIANGCTNSDLFWALKGGGGGFGVITRLTLRTHALPDTFGGAFVDVSASSDDAYRRLVVKVLEFYREALFNPNWGEQIRFRPDRLVSIAMVFQGLDQDRAKAVWRPFFDWVAAAPQDYTVVVDASSNGAFPRRVSRTQIPAAGSWPGDRR